MEVKTLEYYNKVFKETIGRVIYRERKLRNIPFTTFCYENDVPKTTMNSLENGKNDPGFTNACRIANYMGIPALKLIELIEAELPENFWEEWRLAESAKERKERKGRKNQKLSKG